MKNIFKCAMVVGSAFAGTMIAIAVSKKMDELDQQYCDDEDKCCGCDECCKAAACAEDCECCSSSCWNEPDNE